MESSFHTRIRAVIHVTRGSVWSPKAPTYMDMGVSICDVAPALFWLRSCHRIPDLWVETTHEVIWDVPLLMQIYSLLPIFQHLVQSIVQMTQVSAASLEGHFGSLTDLAVRTVLPVIFLLKVLLPNLVTYSLCRAVMRNRAVGRGHLCLTYSANSPYPIFDGSASPVLPGVYHLTLLSQELQLGCVVKCLWTLEGAEWSQHLHRCSFPHLIFILNKSLKPWHERGAMIFESETVKFEWKSENNNPR